MRIQLTWVLAFILISTVAKAQLCQGSLGDPLINITFGSGSNPGAPLSAAATGYQYVAADCPSDGAYTVRTNTSSCFGNTWHNVASDHTGNSNGYFMLVNASLQPSDFYVDTVKGLCGNVNYEFAAWVMNVLVPSACSGNSNKPNLTFSIERTDGTVLKTYNTSDINTTASPQWLQYGFFFTTPAVAQDIVLRITNNAAGGCGNDLALDDITFRPCGPLLTPAITGQAANTVGVCEGSTAAFNFTCQVSAGYANPAYQWQQLSSTGTWADIPGATAVTLTENFPANTPAGTYSFRLSVAEGANISSPQCRVNSAALTININPVPVTAVTSSSPACMGSDVVLSASGGDFYDWTGPNSFTASGAAVTISNIQNNQAGKYYVLAKSTAGCTHLDSAIVVVNPVPAASTSLTAASICAGSSVVVSAYGGTNYKWLPATGLSAPGSSTVTASPASSTQYSVVVSNSFGCTDTAYVNITVSKKPVANAGPDKYMIANHPVQLMATASTGNVNYFWDASPYLSDITSLQPLANPPTDTKFIFNVQSLDGCGAATDTMLVTVYKDIFIPNAFTPNGDAYNNTWYIPALNAYKNFELTVFNRFGETVFRSSNTNRSWDGTYKGQPLPAGAYVYVIDLKNSGAPLTGTVLLLR